MCVEIFKMNKIIGKKLIAESIRGWFVLDNILFGGKPDEFLKEHANKLNEYNQLKKKFLSTIFEFYDKIGYKSSFIKPPTNTEQMKTSARIVCESLKKELGKQFSINEKDYCKVIAEGVDVNNDKLLQTRTRYLGRSLMIENFFLTKPLKCVCGGNIIAQESVIYRNCLTQLSNAMLDISCKYYKNF